MSPFDNAHTALSFRHVLLLYPLAVGLHVVEEWPGFPRWARRFGSAQYSDREYVATHAFAVLLAFATTLLLWLFPRPPLVFLFFALVAGPGLFCNALFHAGATAVSRAYCPGVITGMVVYVPLSLLLVRQALGDGLLSGPSLAAVCVIAPVLHAVEVGHNVFKRW